MDPYRAPESEIVRQPQIGANARYYSQQSLLVATFLGGLIAGSLLLLHNLELRRRKATGLLVVSLATVMTIFVLFFSLTSSWGLILTFFVTNFFSALIMLPLGLSLGANIEAVDPTLGEYPLSRSLLVGGVVAVSLYVMIYIAFYMFILLVR